MPSRFPKGSQSVAVTLTPEEIENLKAFKAAGTIMLTVERKLCEALPANA